MVFIHNDPFLKFYLSSSTSLRSAVCFLGRRVTILRGGPLPQTKPHHPTKDIVKKIGKDLPPALALPSSTPPSDLTLPFSTCQLQLLYQSLYLVLHQSKTHCTILHKSTNLFHICPILSLQLSYQIIVSHNSHEQTPKHIPSTSGNPQTIPLPSTSYPIKSFLRPSKGFMYNPLLSSIPSTKPSFSIPTESLFE